jgi:glycerol uptake facilitator-like aquaporin
LEFTTARALTAELIGTFALVFAGAGSIMVNARNDGVLGQVGIASPSAW